jgi:hypothetical protein
VVDVVENACLASEADGLGVDSDNFGALFGRE